jgi:TonB family protein
MKLALVALGAFGALASSAAAATAGDPDRDSEAKRAFAAYPKESLENGEQGVVHYRVTIDRRGRPRECEVTRSSGHTRLDLATCEMLIDNAVFTPARNGRGRAVRSRHDGKVVWRIG